MAQRRIGIIGYGVIGQQIEHFILEHDISEAVEFFYFDDISHAKGKENACLFNDFDNSKFKDLEFYIGLGYHHLRLRNEIYDRLEKNQFSSPNVIHKTSYIHPTAEIAKGVIIYPMCNIGAFVKIKDGVLINNSAVISHDSFIDRCTFISPGVTLSGRVFVGQNCFIGTGAIVANDVKIGNNVTIGVGTVVTADIADNLSVIGNPMRIVKSLKLK
jgi:sugar O-acyltransferase (sialic acid O-acetyltransferase NeuD family)